MRPHEAAAARLRAERITELVNGEKGDLDGKIRAIYVFLASGESKELERSEHRLLVDQLDAMHMYQQALVDRLAYLERRQHFLSVIEKLGGDVFGSDGTPSEALDVTRRAT
jgi:hypothetical protein